MSTSTRRRNPDPSGRDVPRQATVAIVGGGFAGIGMAIALDRAGIRDWVLLERADAVGGTWRDNTYPGAACDIAAHLYSFSFRPKADWSHLYARQPEIRDYLEDVVDEYGLRDRIVLEAEIVSMDFDESPATWCVRTGAGHELTARFVVSAVGALKDPAYPALRGREAFEGPQFHSARWNHDVDLRGARVGVVGTGASAIQFTPEIADDVAHLTVFQRTPPWVVPRHDRAHTGVEQRLFARSPGLQALYRRWLFWRYEALYPAIFSDPAPLRRPLEWWLRRRIRRQVDDPDLARRLLPDYQLGCKRILRSSDWYPTLNRDHVDVETTSIAEILPRGVRLADGRQVGLDVLIYATGFTVDEPLGAMRVTGLGGRRLRGAWDDRPRGYLGMAMPGFPNLFFLLGPNTGLGHNSVVLMVETQIEHVRQAIEHTRARDLAWLDVRPEALERFVAEVDRAHAGQVWSSGCDSWYLDENGVNFTLWPRSVTAYQRRAEAFDPSAYLEETRPCAD